jgi:hypothetical protein
MAEKGKRLSANSSLPQTTLCGPSVAARESAGTQSSGLWKLRSCHANDTQRMLCLLSIHTHTHTHTRVSHASRFSYISGLCFHLHVISVFFRLLVRKSCPLLRWRWPQYVPWNFGGYRDQGRSCSSDDTLRSSPATMWSDHTHYTRDGEVAVCNVQGVKIRNVVRFQVFTAASTNMIVYCNAAPCSFVQDARRFRSAYCLHHQGVWRQTSPSETPKTIYSDSGRVLGFINSGTKTFVLVRR